MQQVADAAARFHAELGQWPTADDLAVASPTVPRLDLWQREFRHEIEGDRIVVHTAGVDGVFGNADDLVSEPGRPDAPPPPPPTGGRCRSVDVGH